MPFVRTIKKYYKETVTTEVVFACYYCSALNGYIYAKAPIGQYKDPYRYTSSYKLATQKSNLSMDYDTIFNSLDEETAEVHQYLGMDNRPYLDTATRYSEGDIYEDVVSEVEVTVDDDWTRVEVVKNEYYQLAKPKRFYYDYSNEHNTTITGARGIVLDGVASGFSATNYLTLPENFNVSDGSSWEMFYKVRTGSDITTVQSVCGNTASSDYDPVSIGVATGTFFISSVSKSSSAYIKNNIYGTYAVLANTDYWLKMTFDGSRYVLSYSLDGVDYIEDVVVESTTVVWTSNLAIGRQQGSSSEYPWLGSIDLSQSYININGSRWWSGDVYVTNGYWIDEGVASGFSTSQYLSIPFSFNRAVQGCKWEIVGKFNTGTLGVTNPIYGGASGTYLMDVQINANNNFSISLSSNGSSYNLVNAIAGAYTVLADTDHWVKLEFTGSSYILSYSLDGVDYIEDVVVESTVQIENTTDLLYIGFRAGNYFRGSIDLSECYVKINNRLWWHGTKVVEGDKDNYAFYEDRLLSYAPILKTGKQYIPLFESAVGGTYAVTIPEDINVRVTMVGGGGAAAIRGVYDDKGYGWSGGSGGAFIGTFALPRGTYSVTVGSANNNTKGQGGNSATLNPTDLTTHDSYIDGVVRVGGGGYGYYNPSAVGAGGAEATFEIEPLSTTLSIAGNAGKYASGGKGSAAAATCAGGASVWDGYGAGQGCKTSEYASKRSWINGTDGYVRIEMWTQTGEQLY